MFRDVVIIHKVKPTFRFQWKELVMDVSSKSSTTRVSTTGNKENPIVVPLVYS